MKRVKQASNGTGSSSPAQTKWFRLEHSAEGVMARDAVPQAQELPQERRLELAEQRHVRTILAAGQHGAERNQQQLMQIVAGIILPGINHLGKAGDELFHGRASTLNAALKGQPRFGQQPSPSMVICDNPGAPHVRYGKAV